MASVSILLPTRDRPDFLLEALASVARQTHPELELILVRDGGAPFGDAVRTAVSRLPFPTIVVEHDGEPAGAAVTRNRGLERARGDAVAFLDDDDLWEPDHAAALARALDADPDADVVYSDALIERMDTGATRHLGRDFHPGVFVRDGFIPPSAMAARRSAFERFGAFDPDFTFSEDWEWLIRVARAGGRLKRVRGESATIRIHAGGISALTPERLAARRAVLGRLAERYQLAPIEPKTFWEVAASV
ncbi:MAG TPA: glycosyltransferase [Candidatus Eisenbacteria bacterium]|nr:glycosyltransferase [Candidatus Eisenbacteria bacterium]